MGNIDSIPRGKGGGKRVENCSGTGTKIKMGAGRSRRVVVEEVGKEVAGVCRSEGRVQADIVVGVTKAYQVCPRFHLVRA